jgi:2-amino-4-hydroxy-6-hydroxymethyldihydropteridine diphosphokinase
MRRGFIGLGANLGDGRANLRSAWQRLGEVAGIRCLRLSSPYFSEPLGMESQHWFTNAVGEVETSLPPEELLAALLAIEAAMGRDRSRTADRPVDLDMLFLDDLVLEKEGLTLPHPEIAGRLFVLAPLAELAPGHVHPLSGRTVLQLLRELGPGQKVRRLAWSAPDRCPPNTMEEPCIP